MDERQLYNRLRASRRTMLFYNISIFILWLLCIYLYGMDAAFTTVVWSALVSGGALYQLFEQKYSAYDLAGDPDAAEEYKKIRRSYHWQIVWFVIIAGCGVYAIIRLIAGK